MATATDLLNDAFDRVRETVHDAVEGLSEDQLTARIDPEANTIAWLVWHLTRVQDDHVADAAGTEQLWTSAGWVERFRLPFDVSATGYGQSADEVASVRASAELLAAYQDAVHQATTEYVGRLTESDLDRIVDKRWDPPVTLAVRLVSVVNDGSQHAGQAAYVRGVVTRRG
jgi:uncharacterized damage-inducible protein DinB